MRDGFGPRVPATSVSLRRRSSTTRGPGEAGGRLAAGAASRGTSSLSPERRGHSAFVSSRPGVLNTQGAEESECQAGAVLEGS